jgi:tRNA(Arg) A34 adenosine deaminase TadA
MYIGILKRAIQEAEISEFDPYKMGAVLFRGKRILSSGHNEIRCNGKIHPQYKEFNNNIHAEQACILNLKDWSKANNANILIIRLSRLENLSLAYPCPMCQSMIKHVGINKVFYSTRKGEIKSIKANHLKGDYFA